VPKVKDLVNMPTQKYQEMYNIINNGKTIHLKNDGNNDGNNNSNYTLIDLLPKQESNMKNELKSFLKSQLHGNNTHDNNNIDTYDNNHVSYSSFT
jgi:hypothetical protein